MTGGRWGSVFRAVGLAAVLLFPFIVLALLLGGPLVISLQGPSGRRR